MIVRLLAIYFHVQHVSLFFMWLSGNISTWFLITLLWYCNRWSHQQYHNYQDRKS